MVQAQIDWDLFRNISNLNLVEPNRIRDSIYACIRLLFANFLMLKMSHTCTYRLMTQDIHPMLAVTSITFSFFWLMWSVVYMKTKTKNNRANATHGPSPVQKMRPNRSYVEPERSRSVITLDEAVVLLARCRFSHTHPTAWRTNQRQNETKSASTA